MTQQTTRVLIIDSDPLIRSVLETALRAIGSFEVAVATDGTAGLEELDAFRPDCVLVDLLVPGVDGFTLLARMQNSATRPSRVIVSGGLMDSQMLPELTRLGADAVLPRPFRISDLAEALGLQERQGRLPFMAYVS